MSSQMIIQQLQQIEAVMREVALPATTPGHAVLLLTLGQFDALFQDPTP